MDKYEKYLIEQIRYWEQGRENVFKLKPAKIENLRDRALWEGYHDKYSFAAQVLLSALWEYRGEHRPTMKEIMNNGE